jgi:hypothetical protein
MTAGAVAQVWLLSLVIGLVVCAGMAVLLKGILDETRRIRAAVSAIWLGGSRVTNNLSCWVFLVDTTFLAGAVLEPAGRIAKATDADAENNQP